MSSTKGESRGGPAGAAPGGALVQARLTAIFSKRPVAGAVKTRLCPPLEPEQAASLAEGMLRDVVQRCLQQSSFRTALAWAPTGEEAWFRATFPELTDLRPQTGEGLGERLGRFFLQALGREDTRSLVVVGSDQPLVRSGHMLSAHVALEDGVDVVLGPDLGGGYYLVGLREPHDFLFTEVEMSTGNMCEETLKLAHRHGLRVELLGPEYDVDLEEDLDRLRADVFGWRDAGGDGDPEFPHHTFARLRDLFPEFG